MKRKAIFFTPEETEAIRQAMQWRKGFFKMDPYYQAELDALVVAVETSAGLDDKQKKATRYSIEYLWLDNRDHLLFRTAKAYETLLIDPALRQSFEELNFVFSILNKVRLRSDAKWTLFILPDQKEFPQ